MNDLIIKNFRDKEFLNFIWDDKPCWIGRNVVELFGYSQYRRAIFDCIKKEKFEMGIEYDILEGEKLKYFKEVFGDYIGDLKYTAKITIFYEEGLYGFFNYTKMPLGVEFRNWVRREVVPTLRKRGYKITENRDINYDDIDKLNTGIVDIILKSKNREFSLTKLNNNEDSLINNNEDSLINNNRDNSLKLKEAYKNAVLFKDMLDDITMDTTYKFLLIKQIYIEAGIKLPKYIEEERF